MSSTRCSVMVLVGVLVASPVAAEQAGKAEKLAELMRVQGFFRLLEQQREVWRQHVTALKPHLKAGLQGFQDLPEDTRASIDTIVERFLVEAADPPWTPEEAVTWFAELYGAHVTEKELDQILAYYRSPIGQKDIAATLVVVPRWTRLLQERNQEILQKRLQAFFAAMQRIAEEAKRRRGGAR